MNRILRHDRAKFKTRLNEEFYLATEVTIEGFLRIHEWNFLQQVIKKGSSHIFHLVY